METQTAPELTKYILDKSNIPEQQRTALFVRQLEKALGNIIDKFKQGSDYEPSRDAYLLDPLGEYLKDCKTPKEKRVVASCLSTLYAEPLEAVYAVMLFAKKNKFSEITSLIKRISKNKENTTLRNEAISTLEAIAA